MGQLEKVHALLRLGAEDTEEGRTAAHQAVRMISRLGMKVVEAQPERPAPPPAPPPPAPPIHRPPSRSESPSPADEDWMDRFRTGIADFARDQVSSFVPEIVYVKRKTRCGRCGRTISPPQRMTKTKARGYRCVPCSRNFG